MDPVGWVVTPVINDAYKKAKKSAHYVIAYKDYLNKYKEERDKLIRKQTDIKASVEDGKRKGERVLDEVDKWLAWVEEFLKPPDKKEGEKRGGLEFVLASLVVTPAEKNDQDAGEKSRYRLASWMKPKMQHDLGKMAEEKANAIKEKMDEIKFRGTSLVTIPRGPSKYGPSVEGDFFTELKSREDLLMQIMNTLKDDKTNKIGIHGMGGAGKSTLVKEIAKRAGNEMSFNAVIIAEISRVPNIKHIQDQIAGRIGLSFGTLDRASLLYDRLKTIKRQREQREEGGKLLIILDNLWEKLDLRSFGIYPDLENDMGCKIIVTSRSDNLCMEMGVAVSYIYKVGDLIDEEAKLLFQIKVGDIADKDLEYKRITEKLLMRCPRLPLSINVLANLLKYQSIYIWEDIAERLEKCTRGESKGILSETYSILETSYNSIDNEEKKEFFLLCCIFPPGSSISIDDLLRYGIGLGLFQYMDSLVEAIKQAEKWANELVSSSLLLEFDIYTRQIKIHEDIREAGKLIAEKGDQRAFHVGPISRQLKKKTYQKYTVISLASNHNYEYPASLSLPKLKVLRLQDASRSRLCDNYFSVMEKLKVLDLANSNIRTFPQSIEQLRSLKTLLLENCLLEDISRICKLVKLQVLNLKGSNIEELPKELGNLVRLRLLDLTSCKDLKIIHAGMFTNLTLLEGLYMRDSFDNWQRPKEDMVSLFELECCVCLQVLEVQITSSEQLAKGDFVIPKLSSFKINFVNSQWKTFFRNSKWKNDVSSLSRYLQVNRVAYSDLDKEGWKAVMKKAKTIVLEGIDHSLSNVSSARARGGEKVGMSSVLNVFPNDLQKLILSELRGFDCAMPVHCAKRLKLLEVWECDNLEYIFEATKELDLIELPCLEELSLSYLGSFRGLCMRSSKERDRMLKPLFTKQVTFPRLAKLKLESIDNINNLWEMTLEKEFTQTVPMLQSIQLKHLPNLKNVWSMELYERSYNFKYLEVLEITSCDSMESVCPVVVAVALEQLKHLKIERCDAMKQVISVGARCEDESISGQTITFSSLSTLHMIKLPSLTCFYEGSLCMEFSALKELQLFSLDKLETFAKPAERLNRKESEEVECDDDVWTMELICSEKIWNDITLKKALFINGKVLFPSLEKLVVSQVDSIEELCSSKHDVSNKELSSRGIVSFPSLKEIGISHCSSIKTVCPPWVAIELQQLERLDLRFCDNLLQVVSTELESQMVTSSIPNGTISFSSLSAFWVSAMNKLACFYQGSLRMEFPALKKLSLWELKELEMFVRYTRSDGDHVRANSLFSDETAFLCLESLDLWRIDNTETIWGVAACQEFDLKFPKLEMVFLYDMRRLRYVWTGAISSFGNIKNMKFRECEVLEGLFSSSSSHELQLGSHQYVKCDALEEFSIDQLPKIETLLGRVEKLGDNEYNTDQWGQQANRSSKRENSKALFNCKINQLPSLAKLHLEDMDKLEGIYDAVDYQEDYSSIIFPKLKTLDIEHCSSLVNSNRCFRQAWLQNVTSLGISGFNGLRTLFSDKDDHQGFIIKSLSMLENVEYLRIQDCGSLEQIFEVNNIIEDGHGASSSSTISLLLPMLKQLEVEGLPRLDHIPFHMLPNLQSLKIISSLEKSKFLISAGCAAQGSILQHLQTLKVDYCNMDAIVADEPNHEVSCACCCDQNSPAAPEAVVAHEFPSLKQVKLRHLPCLSNFDATATCDVRLPCLDSLEIINCPMLQLFSTGNVIAPQLRIFTCGYYKVTWVDTDLNTTLNMRFYSQNKGIEQWPKTLKHKLHKEHTLTLWINAIVGQYSYCCWTCNFGLDSTCALDSSQLVEEPDEMKIAKDWPLTLNHELHTCELNLIAGKVYNCEICSQQRFDLFSYYCHGCHYGLHPTCALEEAPPVSVTDTHTPPYHGSSTLNNPNSSTATRTSSSDAQMNRKDKQKAVTDSSTSKPKRNKVTRSAREAMDAERWSKMCADRPSAARSLAPSSSHPAAASSRLSPVHQEFVSQRRRFLSDGDDDDDDDTNDDDVDEQTVGHQLAIPVAPEAGRGEAPDEGRIPTDWFITLESVPIPGGPSDASLLRSFGGHVALDVWQGVERGCLTFVTKGPLLEKWHADLLYHERSKEVVRDSGLAHLHDCSHGYFDLSLISAFVERWQPDTNTFHLPFGEMTITLHDVYHIMGVSIEGRAVAFEVPEELRGGASPPELTLDHALSAVAEVVGLSSANVVREQGFYHKGGVPYSKVRDWCGHTDATYACEARGYLFYLLGCTLFPDKGNVRMRPYTCWPLQDIDTISEYAWGAATLAHLYRQLGVSSRAETKTIAGCLTLLQCWIYEYFPGICRRLMMNTASPVPSAARFARIEGRHISDHSRLVEYRRRLDALTPDQVVWTPFGEDAWGVQQGRSRWFGHLHMMDIVEPYHPNRCMRQFGKVQIIPSTPPLWPYTTVRKRTTRDYMVYHVASPALWSSQSSMYATEFVHARSASLGDDVEADYLDWYLARTHPRLIPSGRDTATPLNPNVTLTSIAQLMEPYYPAPHPDGWLAQMTPDDLSQFQRTFDQMLGHVQRFRISEQTQRGGW